MKLLNRLILGHVVGLSLLSVGTRAMAEPAEGVTVVPHFVVADVPNRAIFFESGLHALKHSLMLGDTRKDFDTVWTIANEQDWTALVRLEYDGKMLFLDKGSKVFMEGTWGWGAQYIKVRKPGSYKVWWTNLAEWKQALVT